MANLAEMGDAANLAEMGDAVNLAEMGADSPPNAASLDTLARTIRNKPEVLGWDCPLCQRTNNPVDNLLIKLPPFKCSNPDIDCPAKCPGTPEWSFDDCIINTVRTDFLIRDQGANPTCGAHALLHGMDVGLRIEGARRGKIVAQPLNSAHLLGKYYEKVGSALGQEVDAVARKKRIPCLFQIAQSDGVEYIAPPGSVPTGRTLRLKSWFYLRTDGDVNFLIRLLASGFPLVVGMITGRCFIMANDGELYMSPDITRKNHAVCLIGFCVKPVWVLAEDGRSSKHVGKLLFKARDSKGDRVHTSATNIGTGGDIYLLVEDLGTHVFGFHLELPFWMK